MNKLESVKVSKPKLRQTNVSTECSSVHGTRLIVNTIISSTVEITDDAGNSHTLIVEATSGISACGQNVDNDRYEIEGGVFSVLDFNYYQLANFKTNDDIEQVIEDFGEQYNIAVTANDLHEIIESVRDAFNVTPNDFDVSTSEEDYVYKCAYYIENDVKFDYLEFDEIGVRTVDKVLKKGSEFSWVVASFDSDCDNYDEDESATFDAFEDKTEALEYIEKCKKTSKWSKFAVISSELVDISFKEEDGSQYVSVESLIDNTAYDSTYNVQMVDGHCLSHMGCWVTTDGGDMEFTHKETIMYFAFDIVSQAESYTQSYLEERYIYHGTNFNCSINNHSIYIKEDTEDDTFSLVIVDEAYNKNNYGTPEKSYLEFAFLEEAEEWLEEYYNGELNDINGLYAAMNALREFND